jgi:hypothetical protein
MDNICKFIKKLNPRKSNLTAYIIITDFEAKTEKDCNKMDDDNTRLHNELLNKANKAKKSIKNSGLQMNLEVPPPPNPNNRERFILWKKRNVSKHVIPQSEAIYFLTKEGFELNTDYEAYQAINLSEEVMRKKGIHKNREDKSKDFTTVFNDDDTNIFRRHSMYGMREYNIARKSHWVPSNLQNIVPSHQTLPSCPTNQPLPSCPTNQLNNNDSPKLPSCPTNRFVKNDMVKNDMVKNDMVKNDMVKNDMVKNDMVKNEIEKYDTMSLYPSI